ncbi:MAG: hypothetical protein EOP11_03850 [Proteobacteria bacterium]|nr:MAG: hypothetical protein EOP11_03850 [Pseudomonadota bacterium]
MNAVKISFVVVASIFCFALGISFHASLAPESVATGAMSEDLSREIASVKGAKAARKAPSAREPSNSKLDMRMSQALRNCMAEKVTPGNLDMSKVVVDGRDWAIVSIDCSGERARALYEAVAPFSSEQYVRYSDGRRGVARFFGRLYPPSQCVRVIRAARGSELNLYACSVRVDLDHELIESLKL